MLPTSPLSQSQLVLPASAMKTAMYTPHALPSTMQSYVQYRYDAIPPFPLIQVDNALTILGIQYNDSMVSFYVILQMPLKILTALMPFYKSADTL